MRALRSYVRARGGRWFSRGATASVEAEYGATVYGCRFFIESAVYQPGRPRLWFVREVRPNGSVRNAAPKDRTGFASEGEALRALEALLGSEVCDGR